ncbi:endonuclease [Actinosynnema sp. ALI-1.44]|uniref:endonuclease n=1 Tax=Actinosynnema sp. ALI-1.44 TaxID=1933779 RepID=UPI00097BAD53|nr:endonuclease [Actinosynnema sp. ALI-1.44]ONI75176.1 endonuclease [Actinosynnema sp. ALI-1.44]
MADHKKLAAKLLDVAGETYAEQAGIRLADKPSPLYRLLVLSVLLSTRIKADIAVAAAAELGKAGMRTPEKMRAATWQQRVDALGRAHYVRYDESTATALGDGAQLLLDEYKGDMRGLRKAADGDAGALHGLLRKFPRLGPVGADIFCREAQGVWPELRPYFDRKTLDGAKRIGLPGDASALAKLVKGDDVGRLAAALVRVSLDKEVARRL